MTFANNTRTERQQSKHTFAIIAARRARVHREEIQFYTQQAFQFPILLYRIYNGMSHDDSLPIDHTYIHIIRNRYTEIYTIIIRPMD